MASLRFGISIVFLLTLFASLICFSTADDEIYPGGMTITSFNSSDIGTMQGSLSFNTSEIGTMQGSKAFNASEIGTMQNAGSFNASDISTMQNSKAFNASEIGTMQNTVSTIPLPSGVTV